MLKIIYIPYFCTINAISILNFGVDDAGSLPFSSVVNDNCVQAKGVCEVSTVYVLV